MDKYFSSLIALIFMFFVINLQAGQAMKGITELNTETIKKLESKAIYFGHQSVGKNILGGVNAILSEIDGNRISVVMTKNPDEIKAGVFAHSLVGENFNPESKDAEFTKNVTSISKVSKIDFAFYKYCYVDISIDRDINALFESYKKNYNALMAANPEIKFIQITTPLTIVQKGPRAWIKKIIGRPIGGYAENIKRNQFNDLLRNHYGESGQLFDLAKLESTNLDGSRELFSLDGKKYEALVNDYASDGRHLNDEGSRYIARELLLFMINKT